MSYNLNDSQNDSQNSQYSFYNLNRNGEERRTPIKNVKS